MFALVVVAHPCDESFTKSVAERAVAGLERGGARVEVLDLHALGFRAAMSPEERAVYHEDDPIVDDIVARHASLVRSADTLVFVYPTWWSGLPAILKGWLDRVLVPGVGFVFDERTGKVRPGLTNVRHLVGISTYGSPRSYVKLINDNGRRTVTRALRMSCGWRTKVAWHALYAIDTADGQARHRFLDSVDDAMGRLR